MPYADLNGLSLYYAEHGEGDQPLILLHGGFGSGETFAPVLPDLAKDRRVITVDLQANGRTADIDRPLRWETMADDLAALISHLEIKPDVLGYSLGGGVALRLAIQHPDLIRRLVVLSAPGARNGWFPEVLAGFDIMGSQLADALGPLREAYEKIAPRPDDWPVLLDKTGDLLRQPYDWTRDIQKTTAPVMLIFGDADSVRPEHVVMVYKLLGGGRRDAHWDGSLRAAARLAILPGQIHTDMLTSPELVQTVTRFLAERTLVPSSLE